MAGRLPLEENILGSNPSSATILEFLPCGEILKLSDNYCWDSKVGAKPVTVLARQVLKKIHRILLKGILARQQKMIKILIYGRPKCGDCDAAKAVLENLNLSYVYVNILENPQAQKLVDVICTTLSRSPAVPVIVINHQTEHINEQIIFIEPREEGLTALTQTLSALKQNPSSENEGSVSAFTT